MMQSIHKYPRTAHIKGSRLQPGDEDLRAVPFSQIAGRHLVVEEKMDGANCGISVSPHGELRLQSRGHLLAGGPREKHFNLFKQWSAAHAPLLKQRLGSRYVVYGEWLYAKHTVFYDALPHYFLEFDVLDTQTSQFLDTPARRALLDGLPIVPVHILYSGTLKRRKELADLLGPSRFIRPEHLERLRSQCERLGQDADRVFCETDRSTDMEGLYIKVEEEGMVVQRYKFVRASFLTSVMKSEGHWLNRPIVPNLLAEGTDLFQGAEP